MLCHIISAARLYPPTPLDKSPLHSTPFHSAPLPQPLPLSLPLSLQLPRAFGKACWLPSQGRDSRREIRVMHELEQIT
jgi:hypothetical protein